VVNLSLLRMYEARFFRRGGIFDGATLNQQTALFNIRFRRKNKGSSIAGHPKKL
jgi:hypothetical protein